MPILRDRRWRRGLSRIGVALSIAAVLAGAPEVSFADEPDAAVRALLDDIFLSIQASGAASGAFQSAGPPRIAVADGADGPASYRVELPGVRMTVSPAGIWNLGDVRLNVEGRGNGRYGIALRLPTTIDVLDPAGTFRGRIETGRQAVDATWNTAILAFERIAARIDGIRHADSLGDVIWRAASVQVEVLAEPESAGRWRQRSHAAVNRIEVTRPAGTRTRADTVEATLDTRGLQLEEIARVIRAAAASLPRQREDLANEVGRTLRARPELRPSAARTSLRIKGLTSTALAPDALSLDALTASVELDALDQPAASVRTAIDLEGLELPPNLAGRLGDPTVIGGLLPRSAVIRAQVVNLPIEDLRRAYLAGSNLPGNPHAGTSVFIVPRDLATALDEAQTSVRIERVRIESALLTLAGAGTISVDPAAAMGVVGRAKLTVRGLDGFQNRLLHAPSPGTLRILGIVGILRALGEAAEDEGGPARAFDIELTAAGEFLVNGQDLVPLLFPE